MLDTLPAPRNDHYFVFKTVEEIEHMCSDNEEKSFNFCESTDSYVSDTTSANSIQLAKRELEQEMRVYPPIPQDLFDKIWAEGVESVTEQLTEVYIEEQRKHVQQMDIRLEKLTKNYSELSISLREEVERTNAKIKTAKSDLECYRALLAMERQALPRRKEQGEMILKQQQERQQTLQEYHRVLVLEKERLPNSI
jgi:hypothetical protein